MWKKLLSACIGAVVCAGTVYGVAAATPEAATVEDEVAAPPPVFNVPSDAAAAVVAVDAALHAYWDALEEKEATFRSLEVWRSAAVRAAHARVGVQADIDALARGAYMMGAPTKTQLLLESQGFHISDVINGLHFAEVFTRHAGTNLAEDLDSLAAVDRAYRAAVLTHELSVHAVTATSNALQRASEIVPAGSEFAAIGSLDANGCPTRAHDGAVVDTDLSVNELCTRILADPELSLAAKKAITWAFTRLGAPYACGGAGRENLWQFDCSSYVARAYAGGAGIDTRRDGISPTTHTMLADKTRFPTVPVGELAPGDLVLHYTCPEGETCTYNHVVLYLGEVDGTAYQLHTNTCGTPAKLEPFWGAHDSDKGIFLEVVRPAVSS